MSPSSKTSLYLFMLTALLVAVGCVLYVIGHEGVAQLLWVLASGTAGACTILVIEGK